MKSFSHGEIPFLDKPTSIINRWLKHKALHYKSPAWTIQISCYSNCTEMICARISTKIQWLIIMFSMTKWLEIGGESPVFTQHPNTIYRYTYIYILYQLILVLSIPVYSQDVPTIASLSCSLFSASHLFSPSCTMPTTSSDRAEDVRSSGGTSKAPGAACFGFGRSAGARGLQGSSTCQG